MSQYNCSSQLLEAFTRDLDQRMSLLDSLAGNDLAVENNRKNFHLHIHRLAGSCAMFGMNSLAETAMRIENHLLQVHKEDGLVDLPLVQQNLRELRNKISRILNS